MNHFLEILKYTVPALIVLLATTIIVNRFLQSQLKKEQYGLIKEGLKISLPLRLQAYERLAVFLERIDPRAIIPRVYKAGMQVKDLQYALVRNIKEEFGYNLSQQIYISTQTWNAVVGIKEQELAMINQIAAEMPPEASAKEYHQRIIDFIVRAKEDQLPITVGLKLLRNEAKLVLTQQA